MKKQFDEFEPMRIQLKIAIEQKVPNGGHFIQTMVTDAQTVRKHPDRVRTIERSTYRYSVVLGRSRAPFLDKMRPDHLTEPDFRLLLGFFESL